MVQRARSRRQRERQSNTQMHTERSIRRALCPIPTGVVVPLPGGKGMTQRGDVCLAVPCDSLSVPDSLGVGRYIKMAVPKSAPVRIPNHPSSPISFPVSGCLMETSASIYATMQARHTTIGPRQFGCCRVSLSYHPIRWAEETGRGLTALQRGRHICSVARPLCGLMLGYLM
ncbi:hypothetical protein BT67DRAFT_72258 [Trichocladium antarcticum]|uniref:Uncharacterized protein n=1 Tax=Trichocladium antarcticum TaxID=1450529 RepID=A0AAN6UGV1_9PEZI|nr:hypothetical protein BT67DRAFT_72258 [Trichocladium antarcticum]